MDARVRVWTLSAPEGDDGGRSDGGSVVAGKLVVSGADAAEISAVVEGRLGAPAFVLCTAALPSPAGLVIAEPATLTLLCCPADMQCRAGARLLRVVEATRSTDRRSMPLNGLRLQR